MGTITFNGVSSDTVNLAVSTFPDYSYPEKNLEIISIPGKNGDLIYDDGTYRNVDVKYNVSVYNASAASAYDTIRALVAWLHPKNGYCVLRDSYQSGYYRMAICKNSGQVTNLLNLVGQADIVFNCKPQRYLDAGDTTQNFSASGNITNPSGRYVGGTPIFTAGGSGARFTITNASSEQYTIILPANATLDSETGDARYANNSSANASTSITGLPRLTYGTNSITLTSGSVGVKPKWWTL